MSNTFIEKDDLYRGIVEYTQEKYQRDSYGHVDRSLPMHTEKVRYCIGPYTSTAPIKAFITRNRKKPYYKDLELIAMEKVSAWEPVDE